MAIISGGLLTWFLQFTAKLRAVIHDPEAPLAMGINASRWKVSAFVVGSILAALGGAFTAPTIVGALIVGFVRSLEENLLIPAWAAGVTDAQKRLNDVYSLIPEAADFRHRRALQLSGGQQKLVAIGRARMTGTKLLMLDEPFEGVAPALSKRISEVIASLRPLGLSILLSGADLRHAGKGLDMVYRLDRGRITSD
ncbi:MULTISPECIES: ATP-binding cassette domain-containing protein [Rhizobium]|uniref:ATP-binding cassette domain-containing protein n=1 Tax=Rhizobium TaxID=379 RepID=UPI0003A5DEA3|nr:ATP-binding cassette domain-containing protein [Rhizobium leguminosarum]